MRYGNSRQMRFFVPLAAVLVVVAVAFPARVLAVIQDKVVLVTAADPASPEAWPEAEEAVRQELMLMNLQVETVVGPSGTDSDNQVDLQRIAKEKDAAAAIRLIRSQETNEAGVDLWIVDRITGKTTYRQLEVQSRYDAGAIIDVAVRTVEAFRASLLELRMVEHRPVKNPVSPRVSEIVATTRVHRDTDLFGIGLGGSLDYSPGGVFVHGAFDAYMLIQPISGLDLEINVSVSPLGSEIQTPEDSSVSTFSYTLIRLQAIYRFLHESMLQPAIGISAGTLVGWVEGTAGDGRPLKQDTEVLGYIGGTARGYFFVKKTLVFVLGIMAGVLLPELTLVHETVTAATFGRPLIEGSLAFQVRFF